MADRALPVADDDNQWRDGDAFFEAPDQEKFARTSVEDHAGDDASPAHSYEVWDRISR